MQNSFRIRKTVFPGFLIECTFYRPAEVNVAEFENIVGKLEADHDLICSGEVSKEDLLAYAEKLISLAAPLKHNPEMYFLGLEDPGKMPSDARVDFFYKPTYLGSAIIMKAILDCPELLKEHRNVIRALLLGCTGREFRGHGYDDLRGVIEAFRIFTAADCIKFIFKYPEVCKEFTGLYTETMKMLEKRISKLSVSNYWGENYREEIREVLKMVSERK